MHEYTNIEMIEKLTRAGFEIVEKKGLNYAGPSLSAGRFDADQVATARGGCAQIEEAREAAAAGGLELPLLVSAAWVAGPLLHCGAVGGAAVGVVHTVAAVGVDDLDHVLELIPPPEDASVVTVAVLETVEVSPAVSEAVTV